MSNVSRRHSAAALALLAGSGYAPVADESGVRSGATLKRPTIWANWTYALFDVLLDDSGRWVIVEVNGSNAAGTIAHDGDRPRVDHMLDTMDARGLDGEVILVAYQSDTPCRPEIYARAALLASTWQRRLRRPVALVSASAPASDGSRVVIGTTEEIAATVEVDAAGRLRWRGRPVRLLSNGNVLPAMVRFGRVASVGDVDLRVLHEGPDVGPLTFDKGAQQDLATATGFRRLWWAAASTIEDAVDLLSRRSREHSLVAKINAGSGGTGVFVVARGASSDDVSTQLGGALDRARAKYGSTATAFPVRAFEFAQAKPVRHSDGLDHLWDLRLEVIVRPGSVEVTPLSARICPAPFTGALEPEAVICNLTGTGDGSSRVVDANELFRRLGIGATKLDDLADAVTAWLGNQNLTSALERLADAGGSVVCSRPGISSRADGSVLAAARRARVRLLRDGDRP